jgi:uridine kinase
MGTRKNRRKQAGGAGIFFIGIAGASGCGKTYFSELLKAKFQGAASSVEVEIISCDNYYKPYPGLVKAPVDFNWDLPESMDLALLHTHLDSLKRGETIKVPEFDYLTSQRVGDKQTIDGSKVKIVIVEGLFVFVDQSLRDLFDLKIFAWLEPDICLARRLVRDFKERGKNYDETIEQYQKQVKPAYVNFIEPTKKFADLIISTSEYTNTSISIDVIKSYINEKVPI